MLSATVIKATVSVDSRGRSGAINNGYIYFSIPDIMLNSNIYLHKYIIFRIWQVV